MQPFGHSDRLDDVSQGEGLNAPGIGLIWHDDFPTSAFDSYRAKYHARMARYQPWPGLKLTIATTSIDRWKQVEPATDLRGLSLDDMESDFRQRRLVRNLLEATDLVHSAKHVVSQYLPKSVTQHRLLPTGEEQRLS